MNDTVKIQHFSDILCVWAYLAQVRLDEVRHHFGDRVNVDYHFISVFGDVESRMAKSWAHRGGIQAYADHVLEVAAAFPHVQVHPDIWRKQAPKTSATSHLVLKGVQLLEKQGHIEAERRPAFDDRSLFEETGWQIRRAFFVDNRDISQLGVLMDIAASLGVPKAQLQRVLDNGEALAALSHDLELKEQLRLQGSPTYYLNNGRQTLYGNVGYRIIEANIQEMLEKPDQRQASWC